MRWFYGLMMATGFLLVELPAASAQEGFSGFGGYPAGITTGSTYGFYPGGYRQSYVPYPSSTGYSVAPRVTYYSSGFYGGTPGTTTYGPGVNFSSPNAAASGYSAPLYATPRYAPTYRYAPSYGYGSSYAAPGGYRSGLFGRRTYSW